MAEEQFTVTYKNIPDFPGYRVGDDGSVWSCRPINGRGPLLDTWRHLQPYKDRDGYLCVILRENGQNHPRKVHRLILTVFVGLCPLDSQGCHNNGISTDNRLSNLRWDTAKSNKSDSIKHGTCIRGERQHSAKITTQIVHIIRSRYAAGESSISIARSMNLGRMLVNRVALRKTWAHVKD